ncbi:tripeptidyl-peptidase 2-like protein, partial [Trifolium pratense]
RHENLQILEKMKHLVLFIERNLEEKDIIRLSFFSQPDGPLMGNGSFKSSTLIPGIKEGFYLGPPAKDKLPKIDEDKGKNSSLSSKKTVSERLEEEVRDAKIKVLGGIKQESDEDVLEWNKLAALLKLEYPKYTLLLAKILEGLVSRSNIKDKFHHNEEIINAANEVIDSIDREELAKILALKIDQDDEEAEKTKKKMESTRDQLAEALYQKGLALAEIESLKEVDNSPASAATEGAEPDEQSKDDVIHPDLFDENFKELKKWVDVKCTKYGILLVKHERRSQRLGIALKVLTDIIQNDTEPAKKKLYELKLSLLEEVGWTHLATYERQWMIVRFPPSLPLF